MSPRPALRYVDPLDAVWIAAARRIGLDVRRSPDVFAASDGDGTLYIGTPETLDADDHLSQLILHELCHTLVAGPGAFRLPDWGLANTDDRDLSHEHACLRVQASLATEVGLRRFFAPTTEHRAFWDALPGDPLSPTGGRSGLALAEAALPRADRPPWAPHLRGALRATAAIARVVVEAGGASAVIGAGAPPASGSLWTTVEDG